MLDIAGAAALAARERRDRAVPRAALRGRVPEDLERARLAAARATATACATRSRPSSATASRSSSACATGAVARGRARRAAARATLARIVSCRSSRSTRRRRPAPRSSALQRRVAARWNVPALDVLPEFFAAPGFIAALAEIARAAARRVRGPITCCSATTACPSATCARATRPADTVWRRPDCCDAMRGGEPHCYRAQCFATARALARRCGLADGAWSIVVPVAARAARPGSSRTPTRSCPELAARGREAAGRAVPLVRRRLSRDARGDRHARRRAVARARRRGARARALRERAPGLRALPRRARPREREPHDPRREGRSASGRSSTSCYPHADDPARARGSVHAARRGAALGAVHRRARQPGDAACSSRARARPRRW